MTEGKLFRKIVAAYIAISIILFFILGSGILYPEKSVFDFKRNFRSAQVSLEGPEGVHECTWNAGRRVWACSDIDWNYVGWSSEYLDGEPFQCIWAHASGGKTIHILYPDVLMGKLLVEPVLTDSGRGCVDDAPIEFTVKEGDEERLSMNLTRDHYVFRESIPLSAESVQVEFLVSAETSICKHFCFNAEVF